MAITSERERFTTLLYYAIVLAVGYLTFQLFPVAGPSYVWGWPAPELEPSWPARLVRGLINRGDSWGSAFPSSHVAASMAAALLALRHWRPLGLVLLPFAMCIVVGVVYFQVHYAIDALAGLAIAFGAVGCTAVLCPLRPLATARNAASSVLRPDATRPGP